MKDLPPGQHFLDTSVIIVWLKQRQLVRDDALLGFATLAELTTGVYRVADQGRERVRINETIRTATIVYATELTIIYYGRISAYLQRSGQPIPHNDIWNAALALEWDVPLVAADGHFERVPGLKFIKM